MDPVTLIMAALVAGAAGGVTNSATQAVKDAYAGLKQLVLSKIGDQPASHVVLEQHEKDPDTWKAPVAKAVAESGADKDAAVLEAARKLLALADPAGTNAGKYAIDITASGERSVAAHTISGMVSTGERPPATPLIRHNYQA